MHARFALVCWPLMALACGGGEGAPAPAPGATPLPQVAAQLPFWSVVVPATIEDRPAAPFLVDTGADLLQIDTALAAELGTEPLASVAFGDRIYEEVPFAPRDLATVSGLLGVPLAGSVGYQLMSDRVIAIDYRAAAVYPLDVWRDDYDFGAHAGAFHEQPLQLGPGNVVLVSARFEGHDEPRVAVLDTGTTSAVISNALFDELVPEGDGRTVLLGSSSIAGGVSWSSRIVRLGAVTVGELRATKAWTSTASNLYFDQLSDALGVEVSAILGGTFLREHLVAFDYPGAALRMAPYVDLGHVDNEFRMAGVEVFAADGQYRIFTVFEGTDAEAKGVRLGDVLDTIAGQPAPGLSIADIYGHLRGEPGSTVEMTLTGETGTYSVSVLREDLLPDL